MLNVMDTLKARKIELYGNKILNQRLPKLVQSVKWANWASPRRVLIEKEGVVRGRVCQLQR